MGKYFNYKVPAAVAMYYSTVILRGINIQEIKTLHSKKHIVNVMPDGIAAAILPVLSAYYRGYLSIPFSIHHIVYQQGWEKPQI